MTATDAWETSQDADSPSPLYDLEAEQEVLGAMLIDNVLAHEIRDRLGPDDFVHPAHALICKAIFDALDRGEVADPIMLGQRLAEEPSLKPLEGGAKGYLAGMTAAVSSRFSAPSYARLVRDFSLRRQLQELCREASQRILFDDYCKAEIEARLICTDLAGQVMALLDQRGQAVRSRAEIAASVARRLTGEEPSTVIPTCIEELDAHSGGIDLGSQTVVGAATGMGKSGFAHSVALAWARQGLPAWIYSREMTEEETAQRFVAQITGVAISRIKQRRLDHTEIPSVLDALAEFERLPVTLYPTTHFDIEQIRTDLAKARVSGTVPALVVVDYLQLMHLRSAPKHMNRNLEIGYLTNALKGLAIEFRTRFLTLSQFSRDFAKRDDKRPGMQDLRDSGEIEQSADQVWLLHREEYWVMRRKPPERSAALLADWMAELSEVKGRAEIIVGKERSAAPGTVYCGFTSETARYHSRQPGGRDIDDADLGGLAS